MIRTTNSNLGVSHFVSEFAIGDTVKIDHDPIHCRITAILVRDRGLQHEVSWMDNGTSKSAWVEPWRLTIVERQGDA